jgi:hypothetical protein
MSINNFQNYVTKQVQTRSAEYGGRIRTTAQTVRTVADQLREDPATGMAADFAGRGADVLDRVGSYVEQTPLDQMLEDAEALGRRQPLVVAAAALAAGIFVSRLIKSTAARRHSMDPYQS